MGILGHGPHFLPRAPAGKALGSMNAEDPAARGTGPLFFLVSGETSDAEFFDAEEVLDHAHAVPGSVAFVQVIQPATGEGVTVAAVAGFTACDRRAGFDAAGDPGFRLAVVIPATAGTGFLVSGIGNTEATVHATGRDQRRINPLLRSHSRLRHGWGSAPAPFIDAAAGVISGTRYLSQS